MCVCSVLVATGVLCLYHEDRPMPTAPISLAHNTERIFIPFPSPPPAVEYDSWIRKPGETRGTQEQTHTHLGGVAGGG